jgi:transcriptional regulator with XRE-family HTH domain
MITGLQLRMARAALKWGVRDVAKAAKVSPATVTRIESDASANASTLAAICGALEAAGVIFIDQNGEGPGVRLRKGAKGMDQMNGDWENAPKDGTVILAFFETGPKAMDAKWEDGEWKIPSEHGKWISLKYSRGSSKGWAPKD